MEEALKKQEELSSGSILTFFVKPDEPVEVIANTAAIVWLNSYKGEQVPKSERIVDYTITNIEIMAVDMSAAEKDKYDYIVHLNYGITTATDDYYAPGDGVLGKGTFKDLFREIYIKSLGGGNFEGVFIGTPESKYQHELLAGYMYIEGNTLYLDEVEIIKTEDKGRIAELGLNAARDLPNGYHIHNPVVKTISFELTDDTIYTFTDFNLYYVKEADGKRIYTTTKKEEFIKGSSYRDVPLAEQKIPYFLELHDGKVISITEEFIYTQ